jgi:hypothetical protein
VSLFDFDELSLVLENSYAVSLLRSPNAAFTISFLYKYFKQTPRTSIPRSDLEEYLDNYIEGLRELTSHKFSGVKEYLTQWADEKHRLILLMRTWAASSRSVCNQVEYWLPWSEWKIKGCRSSAPFSAHPGSVVGSRSG